MLFTGNFLLEFIICLVLASITGVLVGVLDIYICIAFIAYIFTVYEWTRIFQVLRDRDSTLYTPLGYIVLTALIAANVLWVWLLWQYTVFFLLD